MKNLRAIIVEDEPKVRQGLAETIDWAAFGLELAGTAANGLEGLELFKELEPHLVIADIRMPVMDGLAMAEAILELKPETKLMIISGHDEFEYAQRCMALGVQHYLLKPIGKKPFMRELEKLQQEWMQDRQREEKIREFEQKLNTQLPALRSAFLEEWLGGFAAKTPELLQEQFAFLRLPIDAGGSASIAIFELDPEPEADEHPKDRRALEMAMHGWLEEMVEAIGLCYMRGNGQTVVICQSIAAGASDFMRWIERSKAKVGGALRCGVSVGIGARDVPVSQLPAAFQESQHMLRLKLTLGTNLILHEGMVRPIQEQLAYLQETDESLLIHAVETNDEVEISQLIELLFAQWQSRDALAFADEVSYQFAGLFAKLTHRLGESVRNFIDLEQMKRWREPERFRSVEEMCGWWQQRFIELSRAYEGFRSDRKTKLITQVIEYIDEHIFESVSREDAARHVHINSSYLSRLFKEVTGEAFSDVVLRRKMEKAVHLLQVDRIMVYEVADRLGYKDPSYFARVFKKYTGKSPSEYQD